MDNPDIAIPVVIGIVGAIGVIVSAVWATIAHLRKR
jgi:hypothetical protein